MKIEDGDRPYVDIIQDWFKSIGYDPAFYDSHTPVRHAGSIKRLTKRERERVESLSKERGYRRFEAFRRVV